MSTNERAQRQTDKRISGRVRCSFVCFSVQMQFDTIVGVPVDVNVTFWSNYESNALHPA